MKANEARKAVAAIKACCDSDPGQAASLEMNLWKAALQEASAGSEDASDVAKIALKTNKLNFSRDAS